MTKKKAVNQRKPFYAVKGFKIEDFKGIKSLEMDNLPTDASWIFLTGENGYGKTCVLQGLAVGLYGIESHTFKYAGDHSETVTKIRVFDNERERVIPSEPISQGTQLLKYIACYGSARLDTYSESSSRDKSPTLSLFDSRTLLENIELQLAKWRYKSDDPKFETKYKKVTDIIKRLLDLKTIKIDRNSDEVLYIEKDREGETYQPLASKQLAAGYRSLISMIGDMILRLFDTQPGTFDPKDLKGIVIIDELDLHFHPKWQKRLPGLLSNIFPRIQFIVSTHSPIPLLGAPGKAVFLKVNRNKDDGITVERLEEVEKQFPDLMPNTILTSPAFGFQDIFAASHSKDKRVRTEDSYSEIVLNNTLNERLKQFKNSELEKKLKNVLKY